MKTFEGWYCAHCQRGVDASEVTFHEQHTVCGRTITDDAPPEQPGGGPVAWLVDYGDGSDPEVYDGERPPGVAVECSMTPLYPESVKTERDALRERVKELEADAKRYRWLREECKNPSGGLTIAMVTEWGLEGWSGDDPDSRIDAAMREKGNDYKEA